MAELTKLQIGKCGELLVQYRLLKRGVESAPMTTDAGIDLVAFLNAGPKARSKSVTIQVKTTSTTSYGGHGPLVQEDVVWTVPWPCSAEYIALVDKERDKFWLLSKVEFQQKSSKAGKWARRLSWYVKAPPRTTSRKESDFADYESDAAISGLLR